MHFNPRQITEASRAKFVTHQPDGGGLGIGHPINIINAFADLTKRLMGDPVSVTTATCEAWNKQVGLMQHTAQRMLGAAEPIQDKRDRRLLQSGLSENALFEYVRQSYLLSAEAILSAVRKVEGLRSE